MVQLATEMVKQKLGEDGDADGGDSVDGSGWSLTVMVVM